MNKIKNLLSKLLGRKQKASGDVDITKIIDNIKDKQKRMNGDLVDQAIIILDDAEKRFAPVAFSLVRTTIENIILSGPTVLVDMIAKKRQIGWFIRECVYTMIANTSGDMIEHLSKSLNRDALVGLGLATDLLKIYDTAINELVLAGDVSEKIAEEQKAIIRKKIPFLTIVT